MRCINDISKLWVSTTHPSESAIIVVDYTENGHLFTELKIKFMPQKLFLWTERVGKAISSQRHSSFLNLIEHNRETHLNVSLLFTFLLHCQLLPFCAFNQFQRFSWVITHCGDIWTVDSSIPKQYLIFIEWFSNSKRLSCRFLVQGDDTTSVPKVEMISFLSFNAFFCHYLTQHLKMHCLYQCGFSQRYALGDKWSRCGLSYP